MLLAAEGDLDAAVAAEAALVEHARLPMPWRARTTRPGGGRSAKSGSAPERVGERSAVRIDNGGGSEFDPTAANGDMPILSVYLVVMGWA